MIHDPVFSRPFVVVAKEHLPSSDVCDQYVSDALILHKEWDGYYYKFLSQ